MSRQSTPWILWLALVVLVPVPIWILGPGWVPTGRVLLLGGISLSVALVESSRGGVGWMALIFLLQGVLDGLLFWGVAQGLSRLLDRIPPRTAIGLTWSAVALGVLLAVSFEIYEGPYRVSGSRASLLQVYE